MTDQPSESDTFLTLTVDIVSSHVANNSVAVADLPLLIGSVYSTLVGLGVEVAPADARPEPAVSVRASIKPDYIVCLEDGMKLKMLKRHLMKRYGMTPVDYRAKWNLAVDYPMVAPNYAEARRALAKKIGLGNKRRTAVEPVMLLEAEAKPRAVRKPRTPKVAAEMIAPPAIPPRRRLGLAKPMG